MNKHLLSHLSDSDIDSEAIEKLRSFVLDLAVRGKLVPQDPRDKPAQVQLELISAENFIRNSELLSAIKTEEVPFKIPSGWEWRRFGSFLDIQGGTQPPKSTFSSEPGPGLVRLIQIRDLGPNPMPVYIPEELSNRRCTENDVMLARYGASVGKIFRGRNGAYNVALTKVLFDDRVIVAKFLFHLLRSRIFQKHLTDSRRMAQAGFNKGNIHPIPLPIPPLDEQHRIVAKIEEFMEMLTELEESLKTKDETLEKLRESALFELASAVNGEGVNISFNRIAENANQLFKKQEDIEYLRRTVLHLAFRGLLVTQNDSDEPVTELLARIAAKKAEEIEAGIITKPKTFTDIETIGEPFEIPTGWKWTQLGRELSVVMGNSPKSTSYNTNNVGVPLINGPVEFSKNDLGPTILAKFTSSPTTKRCKSCDLLVCVRGSTTGRTNIAAFDACIGRGVGLVRGYEAQDYVNLFMLWVGRELLAAGKGMIFPSITYDDLASKPIPFPPLQETIRIVNIVKELFAVCDALEVGLISQKNTQPNLLKALMIESLEAI
jgi:type I restriction enzyme, S subunit